MKQRVTTVIITAAVCSLAWIASGLGLFAYAHVTGWITVRGSNDFAQVEQLKECMVSMGAAQVPELGMIYRIDHADNELVEAMKANGKAPKGGTR